MRLLTLRLESWEEDDESEWQNKWLEFAQRIPGAGDMPDRTGERENEDELVDWIEDCTAGFARAIESMHRFELMQEEGDA